MDPTELDPTIAAQEVLDAIGNGQWWMLAAIAVRYAVVLGRPLLTARIPFFATKPGGLLLVILAAAIGGVLTALQAGAPLTSALLIGTIVKVAAGAVLAHKGIDAGKAAIDAKQAGAEAAAAVAPVDSLDVANKR